MGSPLPLWAALCSHQLPLLVIGHDGPRAPGTSSWDFWDPEHDRNTQAVARNPGANEQHDPPAGEKKYSSDIGRGRASLSGNIVTGLGKWF